MDSVSCAMLTFSTVGDHDKTGLGLAIVDEEPCSHDMLDLVETLTVCATDWEKQRFKQQCIQEDNKHDNIVLASKLCEVGYTVRVREALGGGTDCLRNLRHTFLYVRWEDAQDSAKEILVEPHLKEHFHIASPTGRYRQVLDCLPSEFVGNKASLSMLVKLACDEMARAFQVHGLHLPPWRQSKSMLSK
eukprot:scaffold109554_cov47-Prasinocladus_malaysianus.AAC.1